MIKRLLLVITIGAIITFVPYYLGVAACWYFPELNYDKDFHTFTTYLIGICIVLSLTLIFSILKALFYYIVNG